ncbi:MAG: AmmeMemoRadiSam system protein A [bacterium]|nr:AmmeMemoRadiSam system protein A [bacterium]
MNDSAGTDALTPAEHACLREVAALAVGAAARGEPAPDPLAIARRHGLADSPRLLERRGAFVTLHAGRHLRGCIGTIEGRVPLLRAVADNAAAAAVADPRFAPVTPDESSNLTFEVSALTPLRDVDGPGAIEVGRHGVLLGKSGRQAVFLPQVAPEQGWDLPTMLTHLCRKAGLPADAWRDGARLRVFEADVF